MELVLAALVGLAHVVAEIVVEALDALVRGAARPFRRDRSKQHTRQELDAARPRRALEEPLPRRGGRS